MIFPNSTRDACWLILLAFLLTSCSTAALKGPSPSKETALRVSVKSTQSKNRDKLLAEYLERQRRSPELDPEDALFEEAYERYESVRGTQSRMNFLKSGVEDEARIGLLTQAIEVNPHYHAAHYVLGVSYQNAGENRKAEKHLLKCIKLKPKNVNAYKSLGSLYNTLKDYDNAIKYLELAYSLNPGEFDRYYDLAMAYKAQDNYPKALEYLEKAVALNPNDYDSNLDLGSIYSFSPYVAKKFNVLPDYKRAIELFRKAKEIKPDYAAPHLYLGDVYYRIKEYESAEKETRRALEIKEAPLAYKQLGDIYFDANQYRKAKEEYRKGLNSPGELRPFLINRLAETLVKLDEFQEAIDLLNEAITTADRDSISYFHRSKLAEVYQEKGDHFEAIQTYFQCLAVNPNDFDVHFRIASSFYTLEEWDEAAKYWQIASEIQPKSSASFYNLGLVYKHRRLCKEAVYYFQKALDINPDDSDARLQIELCQKQVY
jgi:protein O-GlcNAc transferase